MVSRVRCQTHRRLPGLARIVYTARATAGTLYHTSLKPAVSPPLQGAHDVLWQLVMGRLVQKVEDACGGHTSLGGAA